MYHHIPKVFLSEVFGELRIFEDNNKFYFCANDICSALGYANVSRELNLHCRQDGITSNHVDCNGVPRIMKFISEGNVYRLICSSHKPDAEMFEKWVFDELLPTIRATGGYVNDPVVFVNEWLPNTDEKTKELLVTSLEAVKRQDKIIGVQKESVDFHHAVTAATNCIEIGEFAKYLSNNKISIGRNRLFAWLREQKYLDSNNMPYQKYADKNQLGLFKTIESVYYIGNSASTSHKTLITPKGQVYLAKKIAQFYK